MRPVSARRRPRRSSSSGSAIGLRLDADVCARHFVADPASMRSPPSSRIPMPRPRFRIEDQVDRLVAGAHAEFAEDRGEVALDGAFGDEELRGDLAVHVAHHDQAEDLLLPRRERRRFDLARVPLRHADLARAGRRQAGARASTPVDLQTTTPAAPAASAIRSSPGRMLGADHHHRCVRQSPSAAARPRGPPPGEVSVGPEHDQRRGDVTAEQLGRARRAGRTPTFAPSRIAATRPSRPLPASISATAFASSSRGLGGALPARSCP